MVLCTLKFAHFRLILFIDEFIFLYNNFFPHLLHFLDSAYIATISVLTVSLSFQLFVALFSAIFSMFFLWLHTVAKETTELETFLRFSEFFLPLLERFFSSSLNLIEIVRNVSPTVKAVATEKDFEPAWAIGDVLSRVVEAPAFHKAYSDAVRVDWTELDATNWWWPCDGFVDSKIISKNYWDCMGWMKVDELTLGDQMHEDNGLVAPCVRLWLWNP